MEAATDEQLVKEFLDGKTASFELLARRHAAELFQFTVRFTGNSAAAEDVVQETLLQMYSAAASFDPARRFKPWLFTIAANKARDYLRRRARRRELAFDAQMDNEDDTGRRFIDLLEGDWPVPGGDMELEDKRRTVRSAVDTLPDKLREVLVLAYYHRLPYKDIATVLEIPLGTVKSRLHAAIGSFRGSYEAIMEQADRDEP